MPRYLWSWPKWGSAYCAAVVVFSCPQSLVMSLSALRLRIVITYLHYPKHSKGLEPSMDDKEDDKRQCLFYITTALAVRSKERHISFY